MDASCGYEKSQLLLLREAEVRAKILHIITGLSNGGAEASLYRLLSGIDRARFEPIVVSLLDEGIYGRRIEQLQIPLYCLRMQRGIPTLEAAAALRRIVRAAAPEVVQGWMYHANLAAMMSVFLSRTRPQVLWNVRHALHDDATETPMTRWMIRAGAILSNNPAKIIFNSKVSAAQHEARGYKAEKTVIIPNGFDCAHFQPNEQARWALRHHLGVQENTLLVGMVARYHPVKGHANLLLAAARLKAQKHPVHFVLVGDGADCQNAELVARAAAAGLSHRDVSLLGMRDDIAQLTAAFDIACSASRSEGFPNVIGEAMACGVPCVVTDVGDSGFIVGNTGRVVQPNDPPALSDAIGALIDLGADGRKALGAAARERIIRKYSLPAVVQRYEDVYESVIR